MTSKCDASKYGVWDADQVANKLKNKSVFIWGAGQKGRGFAKRLAALGVNVSGFLDSNRNKFHQTQYQVDGLEVVDTLSFLAKEKNRKNTFVFVASVTSKYKVMFPIAEALGWEKGVNVETIQDASPFYPTIEVSGHCNLKCSSCPRGDSDGLLKQGEYMSSSYYRQIVTKLVADIPLVYLIDLYIWGEPILNPELEQIIRINHEFGIASGLSTNLNSIRHLPKVLAVQPAQLRVSLSGASEKVYNITHTGGKWSRVEKNLKELARMRAENGFVTAIEVYYHLYKHNLDDAKIIKQFCADNGFSFHPSLAVLFSDYALQHRKQGVISTSADTANDLMLKSLEELLSDCDESGDKNCILTRVLPVIDWDGSVLACCNYSPRDDDKVGYFLETDFSDLIAKRTVSKTCVECQSFNLHRWNDQPFYSDYVNTLV